MKTNNNNKHPKRRAAILYGSIGLAVCSAGVAAGIVLAKIVKPDQTQYLVDEVTVDLDAMIASYQRAKKSGDYSNMKPEEIVNVAYHLFSEEECNYSIGVGYTIATLGGVRQDIQSRTVKSGNRYFEESNSCGMVNIYDRMFMEGGSTDTYWGSSPNYGSHEKKTYSNDEYKEMMGRYISSGLIYIVAEGSLQEGPPLSGDPPTGVTKTSEGYTVEIELNPQKGVTNYQKQMKSISSLKFLPPFEFCHLTFYLDEGLNLQKFVTHEKYTATTSAGFGSPAEGTLTTRYYHNTLPEYGFPEPNSELPAYPTSLE